MWSWDLEKEELAASNRQKELDRVQVASMKRDEQLRMAAERKKKLQEEGVDSGVAMSTEVLETEANVTEETAQVA